jgi:Glycosyl hydrolase family 26
MIRFETAAELRKKAEAAVAKGDFSAAAEFYRKEAAIYRANGDVNGAKVEETKAARYSSSVKIFAEIPGSKPWVPTNLAKFEPQYGCYLGGFIDRDERLGRAITDRNSQTHYDPKVLAKTVGKKHASVFWYLSYEQGKTFPTDWVQQLKAQKVTPHIAWEPNSGLEVVQNDAYLQQFARDCAEADCPIFLRYASEMNGDWTRYGGEGRQAAYIEKWKLVHSVISKIAPKVIFTWCVNSIPEKNIASFYPGDEYVDWVGINFYSVPFYDNDPTRSGLQDNPADSLNYVYNLYSTKKPIAICEFGASRLAKVDGKDRSEWAAKQITSLYASLPRLYPRVRMVDIFDMDNIQYANPGRQLNNYSVTDSEVVRKAYTRAVTPEYFLSTVTTNATPLGNMPPVTSLAPNATIPRGILRVSAWARTWSDKFVVQWQVNDKTVAVAPEPGDRAAYLNLATPGPVKIAAVVIAENGKPVARAEAKVTVV